MHKVIWLDLRRPLLINFFFLSSNDRSVYPNVIKFVFLKIIIIRKWKDNCDYGPLTLKNYRFQKNISNLRTLDFSTDFHFKVDGWNNSKIWHQVTYKLVDTVQMCVTPTRIIPPTTFVTGSAVATIIIIIWPY